MKTYTLVYFGFVREDFLSESSIVPKTFFYDSMKKEAMLKKVMQ